MENESPSTHVDVAVLSLGAGIGELGASATATGNGGWVVQPQETISSSYAKVKAKPSPLASPAIHHGPKRNIWRNKNTRLPGLGTLRNAIKVSVLAMKM